MIKTLLLVDGSSYLYRAYHALPDLRNAQGEPTGALYGVLNMLRRALNDHKADYLACIFDAPGKTFRDDLYPEYKATRASMPEDLARQVGPIVEAIRAQGWPVFAIEGVEADDVIGTLALQAAGQGIHSVVSTGDKDMAQLVNDHVTLVNTMTAETLDADGVLKKFGVPPERIVDYLMLIGDSVDNVPGVEKVGPKTAAKWLAQYGTLEALVAQAETVKGVAGTNLRAAIPNFELTRSLITIRTDCDLSAHIPGLDALTMREVDREKLEVMYERYGFRTWLRELTGDESRIPEGDSRVQVDAPAAPETVSYETVSDWAAFDRWLAAIQAAPLVALDTETDSLVEMEARLVGLSIAVRPGEACYIPLAHRHPDAGEQLPKDEVLARLAPWLENADAAKLLHNAKYDTHVFANAGVALRGVAHDTMLEAYVLESHRSVSLDDLSQRWLGRKGLSFVDVCGKGVNQICFDEVAIDVATRYACEDVDYTLQLHATLYPRIEADAGLARIYAIELPVSRVLTVVERNGVRIDPEELGRQSHAIGQELLVLEQRAYELAGQPFNLNSPKQLGEILFGKLQLPVVKKTAGGAPSTDEDVLSKLAEDYPLPQALLSYRGLAKLKSTYTDKLPKMINARTRRVHTSYAQAAVVTGRLASSDPNLQNIPVRTPEGRRVREAFVADPGNLIMSADYSQIELRIMAHISGDENLLAAFARGEDIHRATAAEIFAVQPEAVNAEQRRYAKVINFGLIYGMSAFGLAGNLGITRDAAKHYIDRYFARYPGVARYMDDTREQARERGYVETVFGRRLWLPEIRGGSGPRRQAAERAAINAPMQGTAADLIKMAMVAVQDWLDADRLGARLVMQVHDELVLEVPREESEIVARRLPEMMCNVAELKVPLVAEVGSGYTWEQAH
ncbi:DNA polymerase I [Pigmentiphaga sp.]|uniref:DNA polymerase I n=1 Tax=Pigmentiphaga sp. TaxID=1977564 RepID=UPI00128BA696|nr:DNA polymerase I [Pigmentiphaga sp.]MPS26802.1 DNA polymerase I [Alcaligenaceae bacterium SAGV5]MPS53827.1 DNA polymerase I [Alcaligenaceae bacterium SAGV3]MPT60241.1 DNA polymerase I [Alcaligenaceae bacterium]